jgi:hypothetical protein
MEMPKKKKPAPQPAPKTHNDTLSKEVEESAKENEILAKKQKELEDEAEEQSKAVK